MNNSTGTSTAHNSPLLARNTIPWLMAPTTYLFTQPRQTVEQAQPIPHNYTFQAAICTPSALSAATIK